MKVLKFGGTSVGSVDSILSLKRIVEAEKTPVIVVVSALGGITDRLIATSKIALAGDEMWKTEFNSMRMRHLDMIDTLFKEQEKHQQLTDIINSLFEELKSIYYGVYRSHHRELWRTPKQSYRG